MRGSRSEHRIVSADSEELILVDGNDRETGFLDKGRCHDGDGILHRAFSLFVFNRNGELLLQQRAPDKRLWPLYWSNSCCSHPRRGESMQIATSRRLKDELNITAELEFVYKFSYQARYKDVGSEREMCSVFLGRCDDDVIANRTEISAIRYVDVSGLVREFEISPHTFTPWFRMEWDRLSGEFPDSLLRYTSPNQPTYR